MEGRIALAVYAFTQAPYDQFTVNDIYGPKVSREGWAVLVGSPDDDIYVQQVATAPQKLLFADNGSFYDTPGVPGDFGEIADINTFDNLYITNADFRFDSGVVNDNYPVFDFTVQANTVTTRFMLAHDDLDTSTINGQIRYTQSDGRDDTWNFGVDLAGDLRILPGGPIARPGDLVPTAVSYLEPDSNAAYVQGAIEVTWQVQGTANRLRDVGEPRLSPFSKVPFLGVVTYTHNDETVGNAQQVTETGVRPSAAAPVVGGVTQPSVFTLPSALGKGSTGIVPGTVRGTLYIGGGAYPFRVDSATGNRLVFGGGTDYTTQNPLGFEYLLQTNSLQPRTVSGSVDFASGAISLTFASTEQVVGINSRFYAEAPGPVTLDVEYAVYSSGDSSDPNFQPGSLTVFAGHDITSEVAVDLLPSGATINIDSPLVMRSSLTNGDTSLRATNINVQAKVLANDRLDIGGSVAPHATGSRQAYAVAEIGTGALGTLAGRVIDLFCPPGLEGAGYLMPPVVTITPASGDTTGSGATARATLDEYGRISSFVITNAGSGYTRRPDVSIAAPVAPRAAVLAAPVMGTDGTDFYVDSIAVLDGGYGYVTPPTVWIAPPPAGSGGTQATAVVERDPFFPLSDDFEAIGEGGTGVGRVLRVTITDPGSGYFTTDALGNVLPYIPEVRILAPFAVPAAEVVNFDASTAANVFEIRIADDSGTARNRGVLNVSQTGSLAKQFFLGAMADSIYVQAEQADVLIEGTVWVDKQTYLMQSARYVSDLAPFAFTTTSLSTGSSVGLIRGGTVGITLANDIPTWADGAVAFNDVDLHTQIDSLRIRAATSSGVTRSDPFPYELKVSEDDTIAIEAVAASSFPIALSSGGNMLFNATLATASDVNIFSNQLFTLSAPVSTTRGQVDVEAQNVSIENSLQVTSAMADDARDDITIKAVAGNIAINGLVSAVNNVVFRQINGTGPTPFTYSNRNSVPITDNATSALTVTVADAFVYQDLDVAIDVTHPYVGDLSAVLIAPDGTRVRLFSRVGGAGDNFIGTIFDSEAATAIDAGVAPFTGRFRPQDSLAPLYDRDARGEWRLEVTDSASGDVGSLTNFTLQFTSQQPVNGRISGTARVRADHLTIDADGIVGNPDVAPSASGFYLRTDVNSLTGRAGASFAVNERNDVWVSDLRVGGLASLRANGVDPLSGPNAGRAALTANISDAPAIDLNAPSGSVDVVNNAPKEIIVGNADALRLGRAVSMLAAGDVTIRSSGGATRGEIYVLDAPLAGSGARTARFMVNALPAGASYASRNPGTTASTISGSGSLAALLPGLSGLRVNDRLLVAVGTEGSNRRNGVYSVRSLGSASSPWMLVRAVDSDTAAEMPANTLVRVTEGPGVGAYQITYAATPASPFSLCPIMVVSRPLVTNIGSDDPTDVTTFVVSTAGTKSAAAGALGKMMLLRQQNDTSASETNPDQKMDFRFSSQVITPIRLEEQLPLITKPFTIDGNTSYNPPGSPGVDRPRITIDGSRITRLRQGSAVTTTSTVNGFEVSGSGAAGVAISNMTIAGFSRGAAVQVQDSSTVLVKSVNLGAVDSGVRLPNQYGLRVAGVSSDVTLLGSTINASTKVGVEVRDASTQVVLVGNTIGVTDRDNGTGVVFASSGSNRLGVEPVTPLVTIPVGVASRVTDTTFTLPASYRISAGLLFPGLGVTGPGIALPENASAAAKVVSVATNPSTGVTTITISGGTVTASGQVTFGNFAMTALRGTSITLPSSVSPDVLYLGQPIAGAGIPAGATIIRIERSPDNKTATVTISVPMTRTGLAKLTFPGSTSSTLRNTVQNNLTGVVLASGSNSVVNTSIVNNALDGLVIQGGSNTVGRGDRSRSASSNVIFGNGGFGICVDVSNAVARTRGDAVFRALNQVIRGNFLGVNAGNQAAKLNTKGNIGLRYRVGAVIKEELYLGEPPALKYSPSATTFIDAEGNQHNVTSTGGSGGGTPTRGVPPVPPTRR